MEKINEKLERAGERKALALMEQISQSKEQTDKVIIIQERRNSIERAQGQKVIKEIDHKLQAAETNRTVQLSKIVNRARKANDRVMIIREKKSSLERAQEEKAIVVLN